MSETRETRTARPPERSPLLKHYAPPGGVFDEFTSAGGETRPHYSRLLRELDTLGSEELSRRADTSKRILHEQGITYNVYGDPRGMDRPWQLDPIPFLIAPDEWRTLEKALIQRATLINAILADCYGPQELIRSGWLPPALVFAQPDFLRPCHGSRVPQDTYLHFYGADLSRSPDGQWWVISDRTQIPTGAGYALANRLITSRIFPEAFRNCHVQRLAGFFRDVQASLAHLAARHSDNPRVVLLTPGPYNETYFEQAYLARYLGYPLVEGQDLTVRDDRVFLKTLSGLEPVHVILRRVDDDFCDPLELRNHSMLGVPGLVEAVRAGNVAVANGLGSGLLQSPAFLAFLPGLCRHIFDEELQLPSIATWWCGQKAAEQYVTEHLDHLFVKPAFRTQVRGMKPGETLSAKQLDELRRRIQFQPHLFVGQERANLSTAPGWSGNGLAPRSIGLRVYVTSTPDGYRVMPGGLTRMAPETTGIQISMQRGGAGKDTWVLSERPVEELSLLQSSGHNIELRRVGNNLPSRLADNFYWLGRYAERTDATARMLRSALLRFNPENTGSVMPLLTPILGTLETQGQIVNAAGRPELRENAEVLEAELLAVIFDAERPGSLRQIAVQLQRLAMMVRDRLSTDTWRVLTEFDDRLMAPLANSTLLGGEAIGLLNEIILNLASFHGLAMDNMTRAQGWRFLDMGRRIERAIYLCLFTENALRLAEADNPSVLETVLEIADSSITYRSRYNLLPHVAAVYDLVLLDDTNPRSLLYQMNQLVKHFDRLPREKQSALPTPGQRVLIESVARLRLADPMELGRHTENWHESAFAEVIRQVGASLPKLSDALAVAYFAHSNIQRQ